MHIAYNSFEQWDGLLGYAVVHLSALSHFQLVALVSIYKYPKRQLKGERVYY